MQTKLRTLLRDFGIRTVSIYRFNNITHVFFGNPNIRGNDIAALINVPIEINGKKYNFPP